MSNAINFHHDGITGTHNPIVGVAYLEKMMKQFKATQVSQGYVISEIAESQGLFLEESDLVKSCHEQL
jgi:hypothetical protein